MSDEVIVVEVPATPSIVISEVATAPEIIVVHTGIPGADGTASGTEYFQTTPLATWTVPVPAGINRRPQVSIIVNDEQVEADVNVTPAFVIVSFDSPQTGSLVIN